MRQEKKIMAQQCMAILKAKNKEKRMKFGQKID
jgi:hypothetical protein